MTEEEKSSILWEIAQVVADADPVYYNHHDRCYYCTYCRGFQTPDQWLVKNPAFKHELHCIYIKAAKEVQDGRRDGR